MKGYITNRNTILYRDTQRAPALGWIFVLLVSGVFAVTRIAPNAPYEPLLALFFLLSVVLYTFTTLTVKVAKEGVIVWFGLPIDKVFFEACDILEYKKIDSIPAWWRPGLRASFDRSTWFYGVGSGGASRFSSSLASKLSLVRINLRNFMRRLLEPNYGTATERLKRCLKQYGVKDRSLLLKQLTQVLTEIAQASFSNVRASDEGFALRNFVLQSDCVASQNYVHSNQMTLAITADLGCYRLERQEPSQVISDFATHICNTNKQTGRKVLSCSSTRLR